MSNFSSKKIRVNKCYSEVMLTLPVFQVIFIYFIVFIDAMDFEESKEE
jgi:hypothetical protein